jgi:hypothetical protein
MAFGWLPTDVMPVVVGGGPIVNILSAMVIHPPRAAVNPLLYVGLVLAPVDAGMVFVSDRPHEPTAQKACREGEHDQV